MVQGKRSVTTWLRRTTLKPDKSVACCSTTGPPLATEANEIGGVRTVNGPYTPVSSDKSDLTTGSGRSHAED